MFNGHPIVHGAVSKACEEAQVLRDCPCAVGELVSRWPPYKPAQAACGTHIVVVFPTLPRRLRLALPRLYHLETFERRALDSSDACYFGGSISCLAPVALMVLEFGPSAE
jgi:hypothetical protein